MDKQKRLDKAHSLLETKVKVSEHKKQQALKTLDDLHEKQQMLVNARQSCSGDQGERISAISCWSRNEFVQLIDKVSLLVEQEITNETDRFNGIESQLKKEVTQEKGLDHLKTQHELKAQETRLRQEQQEAEDRLQRSPHASRSSHKSSKKQT